MPILARPAPRSDPRTIVPCPGCGKLKSTRAALCRSCANSDRSYWTRERIIEAIQWHFERLGCTPRKQDWLRSRPENPTFQWAVKRFGSWGNAIEAAGYPRPRGRPRIERPRMASSRRRIFERERSGATVPLQGVPRRQIRFDREPADAVKNAI